ncbi:MAG: amidohydrolase [Candidatus Thorarchaeota archaeon]
MTSIFIKNALIVTPKQDQIKFYNPGFIEISGDKISGIGSGSASMSADVTIDAAGGIVLPGLIDSHIHTPESLLRGLAQDVPEKDWMHKTLGPIIRNMTLDDWIIGAKLCVLEALKAGTTTFCDYAYNMDKIIEKVHKPSGVRANVCTTINEFGDAKRSSEDLYEFDSSAGEKKFKDGVKLVKDWHGKLDGRITCLYGPQAADMMSSELLLKVKEKAIDDGVSIHMHVAQGNRERKQMKVRYGKSTIEYLKSLDFIDTNLIAVHCHDASEEELALLAQMGGRMVGCPGSIGLIDGVTPPLHSFRAAGGIAALGSDQGPPDGSNMFTQMRYAALLNKVKHRDPTVLKAEEVFRMVTIDAAKVHGLDKSIGSIEVGKKADIIILNPKISNLVPVLSGTVKNIIPNLVYNANGSEVRDVIINGQLVMQDGVMKTMNEEQIVTDAQKAAEQLMANSYMDLKEANSPFLDL